jgi:hypothetical protein
MLAFLPKSGAYNPFSPSDRILKSVCCPRPPENGLHFQKRSRPDGKEAALGVGLVQMAEFGTYPLGQQFPIPERQCVVLPNDGSHQNVGRAHRASQTPDRNGGTDNPSSGADDDGGDTAAQFRSTAPVE